MDAGEILIAPTILTACTSSNTPKKNTDDHKNARQSPRIHLSA